MHLVIYLIIANPLIITTRKRLEFDGVGPRVRFPDDSNIFPEESIHRTMLGLNVGLTRNDRSEQDLDSYTEGIHGVRTDKRELGHR